MFAGGNTFREVEPLKGVHFEDRMTVAAGKNDHGRNHAVLADIDRCLQFVARKDGTLDRGLFPDANGPAISLKEEFGIHQDVNLGASPQGIVRALAIDQCADKATSRPDTKAIPVASKVPCLLIGVYINPAILEVSALTQNDGIIVAVYFQPKSRDCHVRFDLNGVAQPANGSVELVYA